MFNRQLTVNGELKLALTENLSPTMFLMVLYMVFNGEPRPLTEKEINVQLHGNYMFNRQLIVNGEPKLLYGFIWPLTENLYHA